MPAGLDALSRAQGVRHRDCPPRCGHAGAVELEATSLLAGHVLHDAAQPIGILRTIHDCDPCITCAVHVAGPGGARLTGGMRGAPAAEGRGRS